MVRTSCVAWRRYELPDCVRTARAAEARSRKFRIIRPQDDPGVHLMMEPILDCAGTLERFRCVDSSRTVGDGDRASQAPTP